MSTDKELATKLGLSEDDIADYREAFGMFDKDKNGTIEAGELSTALKTFGINASADELKDLVADVDLNDDGAIDFEEFVSMMAKTKAASKKKSSGDMPEENSELRAAFNMFDKDGNGCIDESELATVMKTLNEAMTPEQIKIMMESADLNNDGVITFDEFVHMMKAM